MIEVGNDKKKLYNIKVMRNSFFGIAIGLLLLLLIIVYINATDRIVEEYMTKEISEYGNWDGHMDLERESLESGLFLFPQEIAYCQLFFGNNCIKNTDMPKRTVYF